MRVLPILFSTDMVRALLEERKAVTRRVIRGVGTSWSFQSMERDPAVFHVRADGETCPKEVKGLYATFEADPGVWFPMSKAPYEPGDILYVRETWAKLYYVDPDGYTHYDQPMYYYAADGTPDIILCDGDGFEEDDQRIRRHPSIHMPKEAARIFLKVKDVRVERLQDITEEQARVEGFYPGWKAKGAATPAITARQAFMWFWPPDVWAADPWVWGIEFEQTDKPEGWPT